MGCENWTWFRNGEEAGPGSNSGCYRKFAPVPCVVFPGVVGVC